MSKDVCDGSATGWKISGFCCQPVRSGTGSQELQRLLHTGKNPVCEVREVLELIRYSNVTPADINTPHDIQDSCK